MTVKAKPEERRRPTEFVEGPKALRNFTETMRGLFRVRKADIQESPDPTHRRKTKKAGS
jgi:hypothetical protein